MVTNKQVILKNAIRLEVNKFQNSVNTEDIKHKVSIQKLCNDLMEEKVLDMDQAYSLEVHLYGLLNLINTLK